VELVEGAQGVVQEGVAAQRRLVDGSRMAVTDGAVDGDRIGRAGRVVVAELAPAIVGVEGAGYCESSVTIGQDGGMPEISLPGGFVTGVVRVGDTVRRPLRPRASFVHRLLELFADRGWEWGATISRHRRPRP
jgi:hypothetical protein